MHSEKTRICPVCRQALDIKCFGRYRGRAHAYPYCKACNSSRARLSQLKPPNSRRPQMSHAAKRMTLYGFSRQLDRIFKDISRHVDSCRALGTLESVSGSEARPFEVWCLKTVEGAKGFLLSFNGELTPVSRDPRALALKILNQGFWLPSRPKISLDALPEVKGAAWSALGILNLR